MAKLSTGGLMCRALRRKSTMPSSLRCSNSMLSAFLYTTKSGPDSWSASGRRRERDAHERRTSPWPPAWSRTIVRFKGRTSEGGRFWTSVDVGCALRKRYGLSLSIQVLRCSLGADALRKSSSWRSRLTESAATEKFSARTATNLRARRTSQRRGAKHGLDRERKTHICSMMKFENTNLRDAENDGSAMTRRGADGDARGAGTHQPQRNRAPMTACWKFHSAAMTLLSLEAAAKSALVSAIRNAEERARRAARGRPILGREHLPRAEDGVVQRVELDDRVAALREVVLEELDGLLDRARWKGERGCQSCLKGWASEGPTTHEDGSEQEHDAQESRHVEEAADLAEDGELAAKHACVGVSVALIPEQRSDRERTSRGFMRGTTRMTRYQRARGKMTSQPCASESRTTGISMIRATTAIVRSSQLRARPKNEEKSGPASAKRMRISTPNASEKARSRWS